MSNFICPECGMTNIDCGYSGYKTPKEIELEKKVHILNEANMKLENELGQFAEASKTIQRLQEQINEANELLLDFCSEYECLFDHNGYCQAHDSCEGGYKCIQKDLKKYLEKWGVE